LAGLLDEAPRGPLQSALYVLEESARADADAPLGAGGPSRARGEHATTLRSRGLLKALHEERGRPPGSLRVRLRCKARAHARRERTLRKDEKKGVRQLSISTLSSQQGVSYRRPTHLLPRLPTSTSCFTCSSIAAPSAHPPGLAGHRCPGGPSRTPTRTPGWPPPAPHTRPSP